MNARWLVAIALAAPASLDASPLRPLDIARQPVREADAGVSRVAVVSQFANAELIDGERLVSMVGALGHLRVSDSFGVGLLVPVTGAWYSEFESIRELAIGTPRVDVTLEIYGHEDHRATIGLYTAVGLNWQQGDDVLGRGRIVTGALDQGFALSIHHERIAVHLDAGAHLPFGANNARRTIATGTALAVRATSALSLHAALQLAVDSRARPYWDTAIAGSIGARVSAGRTELEVGARHAFNPEAGLIYNALGRWSVFVNVVRPLPR